MTQPTQPSEWEKEKQAFLLFTERHNRNLWGSEFSRLLSQAVQAERERMAGIVSEFMFDADREWKASTEDAQQRYWSGRRKIAKDILSSLQDQQNKPTK